MAPRKVQDQDKINLRVPDGMRDELQAAADRNNRSMNAEIVSRLQGSLDGTAPPTLHPEVARMLDRHVEAEVQRRLRAIASQIGGA